VTGGAVTVQPGGNSEGALQKGQAAHLEDTTNPKGSLGTISCSESKVTATFDQGTYADTLIGKIGAMTLAGECTSTGNGGKYTLTPAGFNWNVNATGFKAGTTTGTITGISIGLKWAGPVGVRTCSATLQAKAGTTGERQVLSRNCRRSAEP
jgi:hypothetical protein